MHFTVISIVAAVCLIAAGHAAPPPPADGGVVKNPLGDINIDALIGSLDKAADKLKTTNHVQAGSSKRSIMQ